MTTMEETIGTQSGGAVLPDHPQPLAWDRCVAESQGGTIFQTWDWGEARRASGWVPHRLSVHDASSHLVAVAQMGLRQVGPLRVAYCQRGPVWASTDGLQEILVQIRAFAADSGAAFVKVNPDLALGSPELERFRDAGYVLNPSQHYMHRATYRIDLTADEAALLQKMEGRTRRAIARSSRDGVEVDTGADHGLLDRFLDLAQATARRQRFAVPDHDFLVSLLDTLGRDGRMRLSVGRLGSQDVSAAVHLFFAGRCSYMWGGSTDDRVLKRSNASQALHWATMRAARTGGYRVYDLQGTHLDAAGEPDGGTAFFKRGFGGELCRLVGDLELPLRGGLYQAWKRLEPLYLRRKGGTR